MVADPANPGPAQATTLTITASGIHGIDKYGVKGVEVILKVTQAPGSDAKVDPATVTTDASGTATAKFTTSKTKGRNAVIAAAGALTTQFNIDTLLGNSGPIVRGRHSGNLDPVAAPAPRFNPTPIFAIAGLALVLSFVVPYRRPIAVFVRVYRSERRRQRAEAARMKDSTSTESEGWGPSLPRKSRARP